MKKKIITSSMRDQIHDALRELILNNSYQPNTVLQIDRLAEEFGVSATPVREAMVRLEADGLVTLIPNKGAQVTGIREEDIRNTWEMRQLLEPYAARLSIGLLLEEEIGRVETEIRNLRGRPFDNARYVASDIRLHELFYLHLPNRLLKDSIKRVHQLSMRLRYFAEDAANLPETVIREVLDEHLDILQRLRERNSDRIEESVRAHLVNGEKRALEALSRRPPG